MEIEDRERLVRIETKMDQVLPILPLVQDHEATLKIVKRVVAFLGSTLIAIIGGIGAIIFKKHY